MIASTKQGSPWRDQISNAILQLQENGEMQELYTKWWEKEDINLENKCDFNEEKKKDWASKLDFSNIGGIFLVLAAGLVVSFLVAILEFFWNAKKVSEDKVMRSCFRLEIFDFHYFIFFKAFDKRKDV